MNSQTRVNQVTVCLSICEATKVNVEALFWMFNIFKDLRYSNIPLLLAKTYFCAHHSCFGWDCNLLAGCCRRGQQLGFVCWCEADLLEYGSAHLPNTRVFLLFNSARSMVIGKFKLSGAQGQKSDNSTVHKRNINSDVSHDKIDWKKLALPVHKTET